jgi:light-regulated signal transduction histidine kinase (bacteriophytochrome)
MDALSDPLPVDVDSCDREPIHIPGSIQPHGLMLIAGCHDLQVHHVAGDVEGRLGVTWEGQPLRDLITATLAGKVAALMSPGATGGLVGQLQYEPANCWTSARIAAAPTSLSNWKPRRRM